MVAASGRVINVHILPLQMINPCVNPRSNSGPNTKPMIKGLGSKPTRCSKNPKMPKKMTHIKSNMLLLME